MQENYVKQLHPRNKRKIIKLLVIFIVVFVLYWLMVDPFVSFIIGARYTEYSGMKAFRTEKYLELKDGQEFKEYLEETQVLFHGEAFDFYCIDNVGMDNLIYGKACDVYAIDVLLESAEYDTLKKRYAVKDLYCGEMSGYVWYLCDPSYNKKDNWFIMAFCDERPVIKCLLVTKMKHLIYRGDALSIVPKYAPSLKFE